MLVNSFFCKYITLNTVMTLIGEKVVPETMPTADPRTPWTQVMGEEMKREMMNIPPVQGFSQPYTWPTPTGTDLNSCTHKHTPQKPSAFKHPLVAVAEEGVV